ncbi:MAG: DNA recombination protein RmuC [Gammaproteobacteria bacterium]|nr:MAG: DNA recombination protein RmuC [Gammaproteobacteria bacterium]
MNFVITTEYAVAGMILLPLLAGILVWIFKDKQIQQLLRELDTEAAEREADHRVMEEKLHSLHSEIETEKRIADERVRALHVAEQAMTEHFKALSGDVLKNSNEEFRKQAELSFKRQQESADNLLKQREQSIASVVKPIAEALQKTEEQIKAIEKDRHEAFGSIGEQIKQMAESHQQLQQETRNLVTALRRPEVRGQWGELTLKRLVELAGMVEYCDFFEQEQVMDGKQALRPDMVVRMPDNRELIVDAKTPLDAYLSAIESEDTNQRDQFLLQHARNVRERMKELASKAYWAQFKHSPDYVVLFIPGEQFLTAALEQDGKLLEDALANRVVLATPTTIIALLRAVAFGWRQLEVAENAEKIQQLGEDLYTRVATFVEHLSKLGKNLSSTVDNYNKAIGSLERNVLPGARKFQEFGLQSKKTIDEPKSLEQTPRSAEHLIISNDDT